ncbi:lung seven transmembrane receptor-domain-containing protein [Kockovaella imperatae]|uniref:Lung seven transmembrane receptor-domain-containing protein n=1 Tax=Kockovaella imperatae TaxID=4999 RepID=A0A1Y1UE06_9TREE|nr:lung seven transmembrane receptor-domain-containing protein [Kockovaella imperatae]ORX36229.1 lung seven transmembrane receptor-domain-containing protein [Kockovaella imperatae]
MLRLSSSHLVLALGLVLKSQQSAWAYTVPIRDTDDLKEVCSGMWGGQTAQINVEFNPASSGQVALVIYEWSDVPYLGVETPDVNGDSMYRPKTYICTDSAMRQGLCTSAQSGAFITSLPEGKTLESTSIFTQALRFGSAPNGGGYNNDIEQPPMEQTPSWGQNQDQGQNEEDQGQNYDGQDQGQTQGETQGQSEVQGGDQDNGSDGSFDQQPGTNDQGTTNPWSQSPPSENNQGWDGQANQPADRPSWETEGTTHNDAGYIRPPSTPEPSLESDPTDEAPVSENPPADNEDADDDDEDEDDASGKEETSSGWGWGWWGGNRKRQLDLIDNFGTAIQDMTGSLEQVDAPQAAVQDQPQGNDGQDGDWTDVLANSAQNDGVGRQGNEWDNVGDVPPTSDQSDQDNNGWSNPVPTMDEPFQNQQPGESDEQEDVSPGSSEQAAYYTGTIEYPVRKTGYYCVGVVPVTLLNSRDISSRQDATHAEYSGLVTFQNTFEGQLPAVEYPKINFYLLLSVVYAALGLGWAFLCIKHRNELLPMQYYISGMIVFLIIEMVANYGYYRYINKHGGGASSLAFLFVVSILNAARNSLSFFLLLIVSMGLSVITQSLGSVMGKIRMLTGFHFVFGVLYSVGTVEVELDRASLVIIMILIFPLALTLTAFLMWIIVSLNGTILLLKAQKQRHKLQKFQRLWRILIIAVIVVAGFFVISSMSLSNRLEEDYAPKNWRWRWILLDGSLATIYLCVFSAIAWLWRPTRDNVRFSMSQELAQDEAEADAEDYEFHEMENGREGQHQPLNQEDDFDGDLDEDARSLKSAKVRAMGHKGGVGDENVVFAMGDDSDEDDFGSPKAGGGGGGRGSPPEYRDEDSPRREVKGVKND